MGAGDLSRLDQIINMRHELVLLSEKLDWEWLDGEIAPLYSEQGRPGIESRFVIGIQHFTGEEFFQHAFPHKRSDLNHWRQRLGDKLELLLGACGWRMREAGYAPGT